MGGHTTRTLLGGTMTPATMSNLGSQWRLQLQCWLGA
uniref:Uncharacterized protein n=1 Tax=Rhizophora mucronata TaxID=61149 RepID=A0A2P2N966_RHIMU